MTRPSSPPNTPSGNTPKTVPHSCTVCFNAEPRHDDPLSLCAGCRNALEADRSQGFSAVRSQGLNQPLNMRGRVVRALDGRR